MPSPIVTPYPRPRLLIAALSLVALTVAVLQTAVVPILGIISHQLNASSVAVSWAVTANLLAAAASTPLIGRLADLLDISRAVATTGLPPEHAFVTIFIAGAVTAGLAMVLIAVSRSNRREVVSAEATVDSRAMNHEWG